MHKEKHSRPGVSQVKQHSACERDKVFVPGGVRKCLHGLTQRISYGEPHVGQGWGLFWSDWREGAVFSRLYLWGSPGPERAREGERWRGQVYPPTAAPSDQGFHSQISRRKDQPGRLGTEEMAPALSGVAVP